MAVIDKGRQEEVFKSFYSTSKNALVLASFTAIAALDYFLKINTHNDRIDNTPENRKPALSWVSEDLRAEYVTKPKERVVEISKAKIKNDIDYLGIGIYAALVVILISRRNKLGINIGILRSDTESLEKKVESLEKIQNDLVKYGFTQYISGHISEVAAIINRDIYDTKLQILNYRAEIDKSISRSSLIVHDNQDKELSTIEQGVRLQSRLALLESFLETCNEIAKSEKEKTPVPVILGEHASKFIKDSINNLVTKEIPELSEVVTKKYLETKMKKTSLYLDKNDVAPIGKDNLGACTQDLKDSLKRMDFAESLKVIGLSSFAHR